MVKFLLSGVILLSFFALPLNAQVLYKVSDISDAPDSDLTDGVYSPPTLRSAIQNSTREGVPVIIEIAATISGDTLILNSSLPPITVPCEFKAKGIAINGAQTPVGLVFADGSDGSVLTDIFLYNFNGSGLVVQSDNGTYMAIESHDNNGPGINLNHASGNTFTQKPGATTYAGLLLYSNKGSAGSGMQIDETSQDNTVSFGFFGTRADNLDHGNERQGLLIGGAGTVVRKCVFAYNDTDGIELDMDGPAGNPVIIDSCFFQVTLFNDDINQVDTIC